VIHYTFTPNWRPSGELEVVLQPTARWFAAVTKTNVRAVRFALMEDGDLYFGDAFHVLHQDICCLRGPEDAAPIFVGALIDIDGIWRFGTVQFFMRGGNSVPMARKILRKYSDWRTAVRAMRQDPTSTASCEEHAAREVPPRLSKSKRKPKKRK
jgi:hypothetical protein